MAVKMFVRHRDCIRCIADQVAALQDADDFLRFSHFEVERCLLSWSVDKPIIRVTVREPTKDDLKCLVKQIEERTAGCFDLALGRKFYLRPEVSLTFWLLPRGENHADHKAKEEEPEKRAMGG